MLIMNRTAVQLSPERMVFQARGARPLSILLVLLGSAVVASTKFWRPDMFAVMAIVMPSLGAMVLGALLFCYTQITTIETARRVVEVTEKTFLPLRTVAWPLDEFDAVRVRATGESDAARRTYFTVTLVGPRRSLMLFQMADYGKAAKAAHSLASSLGLEAGPER